MQGTTDIPLPILAWIGLKVIRQEKNLETWLEIYYEEKWNFSQKEQSRTHWNASNCTESHPALDQALNLPFEPLTSSNTAQEPLTYPYTLPPTPELVNAALHPHPRSDGYQDRICHCHHSPIPLDPHNVPTAISFKGIDTIGKAFCPEAQEDTGSSSSGSGPASGSQQESKTKGSSFPTPPENGSLAAGLSGLPGTLIVAVPFPGTPGAPYFDGTDVSDFLDRYEDMCAVYKVSDSERIRRISRYCESMTGQYIKNLTEYVEKDYESLKKVMRTEYKTEDANQQMNTRSFLGIL